MIDKKVFTWKKEGSVSRTYGFTLSPKLHGIFKRKGLWSPEGSAEIGPRKLRFRAIGKANMTLTIIDSTSEETLGTLDFHWKDFQRSKLVLSNGSEYYFQSSEILSGSWSWIKKDTANEQYIFRVDSPFHRSGRIESAAKEIPALERDILLLLGLHLQHYLNIWMITIVIGIVGVLTGP